MIIKSFRKILPFIAAISISLFFSSCCTDFGEEKTDDDNSRNAGSYSSNPYAGLEIYNDIVAEIEKEKARTASSWKYVPDDTLISSATLTAIFFYNDDAKTFCMKQLSDAEYITILRGTYTGDSTKDTSDTNVITLTYTHEYGEAEQKLVEINSNNSSSGDSYSITGATAEISGTTLKLGTDPYVYGFTRDY
jgi:hypothetical protein